MTIQLPYQVQSALGDPSAAAPFLPDPTTGQVPTGAPAESVSLPTSISDSTALASPAAPTAPAGTTLFGQRLAAALEKTPIQLKPNGQPVPGSWARGIVGSWATALSGQDINTAGSPQPPPKQTTPQRISGAIGGVANSLGDAAAASEKVPPGGGALTGITRTLQARGQRLSEEQKTRAQMALANAQMIHEQALTHKLGEDAVNESIANGKGAIKAITDAPQPGRVVSDGKTSDELQQMVQNKEIDPSTMTVYPTGRLQTGEDKNGLPIFRTTYTVVEPGGPVTLDSSQAAFLAKGTGQEIKEGQQLSAVDYNSLYQQSSNKLAADQARDQALKLADINKHNLDVKADAVNLGPQWTNALAASDGNEWKAYKALLGQKNPDGTVKNPNLDEELGVLHGGAENWNKVKEAYAKQDEKAGDKINDAITKLETDPGEMSGEKAASAQATVEGMLANPAITPENKQRLQRLLIQTQAAQKYTAAFKRADEASKKAIEDGDPAAAAQLLVSGVVAPQQLVSSRRPEFAQKAFTIAHQLDPNFSAPTMDGYFKVAQSPGQAVFFGSANSLLSKGGTLDQLVANHTALKNGQFPVLNNLEDAVAFQAGHPELAAYTQTLIGTADDYAKVMGGGVATDTGRNQIIHALSNALNNGQIDAAAKAARGTISSQVDSRIGTNPYLRTMYGGDIAARAAQAVKLPPAPAGKVSVQIPGQPVGFIPVESLGKFKQAHPNAIISEPQ